MSRSNAGEARNSPGETPWTRGRSLIVLGAIGTAVGLLSASPAAAAFGIALSAGPLAVLLVLRSSIRGVVLSHTGPKSASEGDRVRITVTIENRSRVPLWFARVSEVFGPESLAPRRIEFAGRIAPGRTDDRTGFAVCRRARGIYVHGPMVVELSDPFDWFTVRRQVDVLDEFKVYPRLRDSALPERVFASVSQQDLSRHALRLAEPDEFFAVRDWLPGDSLKRIHWPLTARRDYPVVREFLPALQQQIVLFLDVSRALRFRGARLSNFEDSVRFAASLAARAVRAGFGVQLRCGSEGTFDVPPANGPGQHRRILDALVRIRTRNDDAFAATLSRRTGLLPPGATAVVVLHPYLLGDAEVSAALVRLRRKGLRVACVVYQVRSDLVGPATMQSHSRYLAALASAGIELWTDSGAPLAPGRVPVSKVAA
jgi:uncharacterized protein (DUF58 family)